MAVKTTKSMVAEERDWQTQQDARTLAQAEEIKADSARKKRAIVMVRKMVKDKEKEVKSFQKIAKTSPKPKKTKKKK